MRTMKGSVKETARCISRTSAHGGRRSRRGAAPAGLLFAALLSHAPATASVTIQSFSGRPAAPTTGDPVILSAVVQSTSSCDFIGAAIGFGPQPELGGQSGWAITLDFRDGDLPVVSTCPIEKNFGALPMAEGDGVLRARNNGTVNDVRLFTLTVAPGPVPGWDGPAVHGSAFSQLTLSSALTALPGRLAMSDLLGGRILLLDPGTEELLSSFPSPGSGDVRGLASDGTNLYASVRDGATPRVYKVDLLGRVLDVFNSPVVTPGSAPLEGLAFLDGVLYGSYESPPRLFAINPSTHQKLWERPLPGRILGLDAAPEGLLGAEAGGTFYLIEPAPAGRDVILADPIDTGVTPPPNFTGLAYDGFAVYAWDSNTDAMLVMRTFGLWWAMDGTLRIYVPGPDMAVDVIRGNVDDVQQLAGYFELSFLGPATCLAGRSGGGAITDLDAPLPGHAFFYVARFIDAADREGSYGRTSEGFRRIDSSEACP